MAFWRKRYTSKFTGPAVDALLTKAGTTEGLPAVTSTDNGKLLKVVSGKWAVAVQPSELPPVTLIDVGKVLTVSQVGTWGAAAPAGGISAQDVNLTVTLGETNTATSSVLGSLISAAVAAGKMLRIKTTVTVGGSTYTVYSNDFYHSGTAASGATYNFPIRLVTTADNVDTYRYIVVSVPMIGNASVAKSVTFNPAV